MVYLLLYFPIFLIYMLKVYAIFHYPPTQPNIESDPAITSHIFKFKLTQERRAQI